VSVPYFLLFLCFRKVTQEIFSELDETCSRSLIFSGRVSKTKRELERGQRLPSPPGARPRPWPRPPVVRSPWSTPDDAPSPTRSLPTKNPKTIGVFPRTVLQRHRRRRQISGDRSLYSGTCYSCDGARKELWRLVDVGAVCPCAW
jgi:hypothetical protein